MVCDAFTSLWVSCHSSQLFPLTSAPNDSDFDSILKGFLVHRIEVKAFSGVVTAPLKQLHESLEDSKPCFHRNPAPYSACVGPRGQPL